MGFGGRTSGAEEPTIKVDSNCTFATQQCEVGGRGQLPRQHCGRAVRLGTSSTSCLMAKRLRTPRERRLHRMIRVSTLAGPYRLPLGALIMAVACLLERTKPSSDRTCHGNEELLRSGGTAFDFAKAFVKAFGDVKETDHTATSVRMSTRSKYRHISLALDRLILQLLARKRLSQNPMQIRQTHSSRSQRGLLTAQEDSTAFEDSY